MSTTIIINPTQTDPQKKKKLKKTKGHEFNNSPYAYVKINGKIIFYDPTEEKKLEIQ
jgi:hypothetical protein